MIRARSLRSVAVLFLFKFNFCVGGGWAQTSPGTPDASSAAAQQLKPAQAAAVSSKTQEAYVIEGVVSRISFENDGTETQETQASIHILSDAGVQRWGVVSFSYQNFNQTLDIDYVRVKKADGTLVGHTSRKHTRHHL